VLSLDMTVHCNCGWLFKVTGILQHLHQSKKKECHTVPYRFINEKQPVSITQPSPSTPTTSLPDAASNHVGGIPMEVDPMGDYFGNYASYNPDELGMANNDSEDDPRTCRRTN